MSSNHRGIPATPPWLQSNPPAQPTSGPQDTTDEQGDTGRDDALESSTGRHLDDGGAPASDGWEVETPRWVNAPWPGEESAGGDGPRPDEPWFPQQGPGPYGPPPGGPDANGYPPHPPFDPGFPPGGFPPPGAGPDGPPPWAFGPDHQPPFLPGPPQGPGVDGRPAAAPREPVGWDATPPSPGPAPGPQGPGWGGPPPGPDPYAPGIPQGPGPDQYGPGAPQAPGMPSAPGQGYRQSAPGALDEVALLRKARRAPHSGWRRAVHRMSGGSINPGESPDALHYAELVERVNRPVRGDYRIAVLSLKGGVGKTTATVGLGSIFASLRGDRVIAVDANPDLGTLGQRVPQQTRSTVRDLLADNSIYRYSDVRAHTSQSPSRLEVLASERDPAVAEAFSEEDYRGVMKVLQRFYNIIITDCGTGLSHSAMNGVLDLANALILVSSPAIDGARSAGATLDWLQAHGYGHLVSRAVVVLSHSRSGSSTIDTKQLSQHFLTRCRAVQMIPFDDHLAEGAEVDLELLNKHTHRSLVELAAVVADDFSSTTMRRVDPYLG
ncbi:MinD/ParA family protein [uncultured Williamsia sp.]|uniref:MinD/ParA family ATP-binding protein n=1 Tax=uncultured Williamsia sp. TaxID=259311 RepID=UPI00261318CE|nr:MinD/ParA family protein [uncultured Williamsia sp.]